MKRILLYLIILFIPFSCSKNSKDGVLGLMDSESLSADFEEIDAEPAARSVSRGLSVNDDNDSSNQMESQIIETKEEPLVRKLERKINMTVSVEDVVQERNKLKRWEKRFDAYTEEEDYYVNHYYLTMRVPSEKLDAFMDSVIAGTTGKIVDKHELIKDLSSTYYDNLSRKKSMDAAMDRYRELMKQAKNVSEILEIQRQIDRIQEQADLAASRVKNIDNRVTYSTVSFEFRSYSDAQIDEEGFFSQIWNGLKAGWNGLISFVIILVHIWPLILVLVVAGYFIIKRRMKKKNQEMQSK